jgi:hypothetical protein
VTGATWRAATRIVVGVEDLVQMTGDGRTGQILSDRTIGRSGDAVRDPHHARRDVECGFLDWGSKPRSAVCQWFGLKTTRSVFSGLASTPVATVFSGLASKPVKMVSSSLASEPVVGFLAEPQNQGGGGFPSLGLKTGSYGLVIWTSKSPRRFLGLGLKTKRATVCRLHHKTVGRVTAWDTY